MRGQGRHRHWRARWALVWALAAFAVLQLGLALLVDWGGPGVCDLAFKTKAEHLLAKWKPRRNRTLVLMIGSSRTRMGLLAGRLCRDGHDPYMLAFNFGLTGSGPVMELVYLRRLLAAGFRPDLLFIEVLPAVLTQADGFPFEEHWLHGSRLQTREIGWIGHYSCKPWNLLRQWCSSRWLPCIQFRKELLHEFRLDDWTVDTVGGDAPPPGDGFGWEAQYLQVTPEQCARLTQLAHGQYDDSLADTHVAIQPAQALADLLALCRQHGISSALVLMPESSGFRVRYSPQLTASLRQLLVRLQQQWHVPVIDARTWVADGDFWDGHHLLPGGAAVFTRRFEREAVRPLVRIVRPRENLRVR